MKKLLLAVTFLLGYITFATASAMRYVPPATTPVGTTISGPTGTVSSSPITITITTARPVSTISNSAFTITNAQLTNLTQKLTLTYSAQFGTTGTSGNTDALFSNPNGIATNGNGIIYVVDAGNNRIKILNESGTQTGVFGAAGSGDGQFNTPTGIAVDGSGKVYVSDRGNGRVEVFDANGNFLTTIGSAGSGNGQLNIPRGIYISADGHIYVANAGNNRIEVFNSDGTFNKTIGSAGNGNGEFYSPSGITADAAGNIYITDSGNGRVQKFTSAGAFTTVIGGAGSADGQFNTPVGIVADGTGKIYVVDNTLHRVQAFTTTGVFLGKLGGTNPGTTNTQFNFPTDIAADKNGKFYVVDQANQRVAVLLGKSVYTATLEPDNNGLVTVDLAADKGFDNNGNGNAAATYSVTYFNATPAAPTGLTGTSLDGKVQLDWTANPVADDILSYKIFWGTSPNPTTLLTSVSGAVTTYTTANTPLVNGTTYYYRITAVNSVSNESAYSAQVAVIPKATPIVTLTNPVNISYGTEVTAAMINAQGSVPGTFTYDGETAPRSTIYNVTGPNTIVVVFHPTDAAAYNDVTTNVSINVAKAIPVFTVNTPVSVTYGTAVTAAMVDAHANIPGDITYDGHPAPSATGYTVAGPNSILVKFLPTDGDNYAEVDKTVDVIVTKATPVIDWTLPASIPAKTDVATLQTAVEHSGISGTFSYVPASGVLHAGLAQQIKAIFTPTDAADYNTVEKILTIDVSQLTPTLTWLPSPAAISYGTPLVSSQLNASADNGLLGPITYNHAAGDVLTIANSSITAHFVPDDQDYQPVDKTISITVNKGAPAVTLTNPLTINYGTQVTEALINAQANVPGTFTYDGLSVPPTTIYPVGSSSMTVVFHPTDATNYDVITNTLTINVTKANPIVTLTNPINISYGTHITTAMVNAQANVAGTFTYDGLSAPPSTNYTVAGPNSMVVVFHPTDATNYEVVTNTVTINVTKANPTVTLNNPVTIAYGTQVTAAMINAQASVPGTFTYDGASTPPSTIYPVTGGSIVVVFHPTDAANYNTVTNTVTITVAKTNPVVTLTNPVNITYGTVVTTAMINAQASVPGTFTYDGASTPPSTIYPVTGGSILVVFHPTDAANYNTISNTVAINVTKTIPIVTLTNPVNITYGTQVTTAMVNAQASVPGTFTYDGQATPPNTIYPVTGGSMVVVFHPTDATNYEAVTNTVSINVTKATPIVTLVNPVTITYGTQVTEAMINAQANVPGTFTYDGLPAPPSTIYTVAGPNSMTVVFHPADATNYEDVTNTVIINVNRIDPIVTLNNPITIAYGTQVTAAMINAHTNIPGTFTYDGLSVPPATIYPVGGSNSMVVVFHPTDAVNYSPITNTVIINVNNTAPVVTLNNPITITYGTTVTTAMINAHANVPGTFTYDGLSAPPSTIYPVGGANSIEVVFHPTDASNYTTVTKTVTINVNKKLPIVTLNNPLTITYGTAVTTAMINAHANVPGTFTYDGQVTPPATIYTIAGPNSIAVVFHPTDVGNYNDVTNTVVINVNPITPIVTLNNPVNIAYGTQVTTAMINAHANVPGTFTYDGQATPPATIYTIAGPNSMVVVFHPADTNYGTITNNVTINVTKANPTVTLNNPIDISYGTTVTTAMINAHANVPGTFTYDGQTAPPSTIYPIAGPNSIMVVFHPTDAVNYSSVSNTVIINVDKTDPVVTLNNPLTITYGTQVTTAMINAHANVAGTFTYDGQATPPATIYSVTGPNSIVVVFHPTNATSYNTVTNTVTINVNKIAPVVTLNNPVNITYGTQVTATMINAQANVAGTFTYDGQATPPATIYPVGSSNTITVVFHPTNTADYSNVTNTVTVNVNKLLPVVTLNNPINVTYGTLVTAAVINAQADVPGTFTYNGQAAPPATLYGVTGPNTIEVVFHPTDATNYSEVSNTVNINVSKGNPRVTLNNPVNITYGTVVTAGMINAHANVPGTFTYDGQPTPPSTIYPVGGANTIQVVFYPTDAANYNPITNTVTVTIGNTDPIVTLNSPININYGTQVTAAMINAHASVPGTFTYDGQAAPLSTIYPVNGNNTIQVVFHPTDNTTYNTIYNTVTVNVNKRSPVVTLNNPITVAYGTPVTIAMINAQASVPGTFTYNGQATPPATIYSVAGPNTIAVVFNPTDAINYGSVSNTVTINVTPLTPVVTVNNPISIAYGTQVTTTMINAHANIPGTFTYDGLAAPPSTIYPVNSTNSIAVVFHPTDVNYGTITNTVTVNVGKANPVVTLNNPVSIAYGTQVTAAMIDAHADVPGTFTYDGAATPPSTIYTIAGPNSVVVVFHPADGANYNDVTNTVTINVNQATPVVTFNNPVNINYGTQVTETLINAQASVPGTFTYDGLATPPATIYPAGSTSSMVLVFHPTDAVTYRPVTRTITINVTATAPLITVNNPVNITYGTLVTAGMINAQANVAGTFTYDGLAAPAATIYPANTPASIVVTFHPTDAVNYSPIINNVAINVTKAVPTVTLNTPINIVYGTQVTTAMINAQASVPGTFSYDGQSTPPSTLYSVNGPNSMEVVFHPTDAANYQEVTNTVIINATISTPVVTLTNTINIAYGTQVTAAMINAQASVAGTFSYDGLSVPPAIIYPANSSNTMQVVFHPADPTNYQDVSNTVTINVNKATPMVTMNNPVEINFGTPVTVAMINAQASVPGTFTYDGQPTPPATIYPIAGPNSMVVVFHPTDAANYNDVSSTVVINVTGIIPVVTLTNPVNITYGTQVTTTMINAQANVPGTFTYDGQATPPASNYTVTGPNSILVVFHPTDVTNYNSVSKTVVIHVTKAAPLVTLNNAVSIAYGEQVTAAMINAQGSAPGTFTYDGQATPPVTNYTVAGPNTMQVVFHPTDGANYQNVTSTVTINVSKANPIVTLTSPVSIPYGTQVTAAMINAQGSVPGTFTYDGQTTPPSTTYTVAGPNSIVVVFHPTDADNYQAVTNTVVIAVTRATPVVTLNNPLNISYGTPVTTTLLNPQASVPGTFTYDGQPVPPATIYPVGGANSMLVVFTPTDNVNYTPVSTTVTINVGKIVPLVTLNTTVNIPYGTLVTKPMINAQASVPGTFTYDGLSAPPVTIYPVAGPNSMVVVFHPTDAVNYDDVTNTVTINVTPLNPVVTLNNPVNITYGTLVTTAMINPQSDVPGTFTYDGQAAPPATVYTVAGPNTLVVVFHPIDENYNEVTNNVTINVTTTTPVVTLTTPINITYGTPVTAAMINAQANVPGTFTYDGQATPPSTLYAAGGSNGISVVFHPTDAAAYSSVSKTVNVIVAKASPSVTLNNPVSITYGTQVTAAMINAQANIPGTFTYDGQATPPSTIYPVTGPNSILVVFHPTDGANYNSISNTVTVNVDKADPVVTLNTPVNITYGQVVTAAIIGAQANVPGTFTYNGSATPPSTIYPIGSNTITVVFHPSNAANYNSITNTVSINVNKITPVVTLNNPITINYGTLVTTAMINAHASVPGTFTYDGATAPPATIYTAAGPNTIAVLFHPTNSNYSDVSASVTVNVNKVTPTITWTNPVAISYGTALGDAQLYATASVAGTFTYTPAAGTVLNAGNNQPLKVVFTPTDPNYNAVPKEVVINVTKVPLIISADNLSRPYYQPNPTLTASYNGFVNNDTPASLTTSVVAVTTATQASPAGTYPITLSGASSGNYNITYVSGTLTINTIGRDITFDKLPVKTYGDADFDGGATSTTGEPIIYTTSNPAIATIVDGKIHIVGAGYVTITASLAPNPSYNTTPSVSQFLIVNKATQVIDFASIPAQMRGTTYDLSGIQSSSGLPVSFTVNDETVATISGLTLSSLRIGVTGIVVNQAGNANYYPAVAVVRELKVIDATRDVIIHPAVSPNADGINDFLYIEGISEHPANRITIINRNGVRVYEITGYNNTTKVFDGHSNFTGALQQAGTYFYLVEYIGSDGVGKHLTGYFVLKY